MVRPAHLLYPPRVPVALRAASTLLLLRDGPQGLEVLMTRRSERASFAPGAFVFPGGGVDDSDSSADAHAIATQRPDQSDLALTQAITAIRESYEELGILLAHDVNGQPVTADTLARIDRAACLTNASAFVQQCSSAGLTLATDQLFLLAHWITGRDLSKRFDVPFLVARMPSGQQAQADGSEQFEPTWVRPQQALAQHDAGAMLIIFPTYRTLQWLSAHPDVASVLAACHQGQPLWTSCPRAGLLHGRQARYMEHEAPYGELALVCPDGQIVHDLSWQHERPVRLLKNLQRLTAPNPGPMTGPGTNSYLVGTAASGFIVIDPGPADEDHVARLLHATQGDIRAIVCTHSHRDHAPAAWMLQAAAGLQRTRQPPPVLGRSSGPHADRESVFRPDRELADDECLSLQDYGLSHTLRVIHTPGHASNHLCLLFEEEGLLFSGDHILSGMTPVILPPDGNMTAYLASLDRLQALCDPWAITTLLPAHGYAIAPAGAAITQLKRHRLARERKIQDLLSAHPSASAQDLLPQAYDDVMPALWPVALGSLQAHLERLRDPVTTAADGRRADT